MTRSEGGHLRIDRLVFTAIGSSDRIYQEGASKNESRNQVPIMEY